MVRHSIFVTGATGYIGRPLTQRLRARGHAVKALVRSESSARLGGGVEVVFGDALRAETYADQVAPSDTFVHLIGTPRPNPSKARQFQEVDLASLRGAVDVAVRANVAHFVYVSVAQPAPVMRAYVAARAAAEAYLRESGLNATIIRPWYVLGPGHRWPYLLIPMYALMRLVPTTREGARRLGLVTREQMLEALVRAVENPARGQHIVTVEEIRRPTPAAAPAATAAGSDR